MKRWMASLPQPYARWCACLLFLLVPGSFVLLPALWLIRLCREGQARSPSPQPPKACADVLRP